MEKKTNKLFFRIMGIFFIIFMGLFIANISGYYESRIKDKVLVTDNKIKEFEEKIHNGEEIDVTSFLNKKEVDYSSPMSNLGEEVTGRLMVVINDGAKIIQDILKSLF